MPGTWTAELRSGVATGALPRGRRLTAIPRRDGADDHHGITPTHRAADCPFFTPVTSRSVLAFGLPNGGYRTVRDGRAVTVRDEIFGTGQAHRVPSRWCSRRPCRMCTPP